MTNEIMLANKAENKAENKIANRIDIKSLSFDELLAELSKLKVQKFRASQIFDWLHQKKVNSFSLMTNLPKTLLPILDENYYITEFSLVKKLKSKLDETAKYLLRLSDGNLLETVLMKYKHGNSLCVSTQIGCKMGCTFCASTKAGFVRNLTASEILEQVYFCEKESGERVSSIVLMGIGEPLDNYDNVLKFLYLINDERGSNLSMRNISLSTCGLCDKIDELSKLSLPLTLSISLHAPNDYIRNQTMPINKKYDVATLIRTCRNYANKTSRRISFEYALINGFNDSDACADELAGKLRGMLAHVNLIPINEIKETTFIKSGRVQAFCDRLNERGITTTIRRTLGSDISAACGQLRRDNI